MRHFATMEEAWADFAESKPSLAHDRSLRTAFLGGTAALGAMLEEGGPSDREVRLRLSDQYHQIITAVQRDMDQRGSPL